MCANSSEKWNREITGRNLAMTNNERFNQLLNSTRHPREVFTALATFCEPTVQDFDNSGKELEVPVGKVFAGLNVAKRYSSRVGFF